MAFVPISLTVESVIKAQRGGRLRINTLHWRYSGLQPTVSELSNLNADIENAIIQEYEDFVSIGTQWYEILSRDLHSPLGAQHVRAINRLSAGPIDDLPGGNSYVLSKRTGVPGRSYRGRFYLIDLPEDFFNGDDFNAIAYNGPLSDLITQLLLPRQAGRFTPAVASRTLGISTPIQSITHDGVADSQRRRLKGRGP